MSEEGDRRGSAATAVDADDPVLRGRTLGIPFDPVWQAAVRLAGGGLRGWRVLRADDEDGVINAYAPALFGEGHDVVILVTLDQDGQTRVDARALARTGGADFGRARRRVRTFFAALDRALANSTH